MRFALLPPRETFIGVTWVSHVKVDLREMIDLSERQGVCDVRYTVQHLEVFKQPSDAESLPAEVYGSTMGGFSLEEGKEYLLCGSITEEGRLCCVGGQIRPDGVEGMVAEWRELKREFIEEMKTFEQSKHGTAPRTHLKMRFGREKVQHLCDWRKSMMETSNWVSRVKVLRVERLPATGIFDKLYWVKHVEVFKKPHALFRPPTELYGSQYSSDSTSARVGREFLVCGGGTYSMYNKEVRSRDDETRWLEDWSDLTESFVDELRFYMESHPRS